MRFRVVLHFYDARLPMEFSVEATDAQSAFDGAAFALPEDVRRLVAYGELYPLAKSEMPGIATASARVGVSAEDVFDRFLAEDGRGKFYLREAPDRKSVVLRTEEGESEIVPSGDGGESLPESVRGALRGLYGVS